ncbi:MAG: DUF3391 domain-containing protein [Sinobacteraceae bacterium]|nr:DUF3391 domain-containing protein [Nevskiaceae bacterium]
MSSVAWQPIEADALRIGHFVRIGDRWFKHPFLQSSFCITTADELTAIRAAELTRIFIDPARSKPVAVPAAPPHSPALPPVTPTEPPVLQPAAAPGLTAAVIDAIRRGLQPPAPTIDPRLLQDNLSRAREGYRGAVGSAAQALTMLDAGDARGIEATHDAVRQVLSLAAGRERPLTLAAVATPVGAQRRQASLSMNAAALAAAIGGRLQLSAADLQTVTTAAMLHAIGLSRLPPRLRDESRIQSRDDLAEFRRYPQLGAAILCEYPGCTTEVIRVVAQHRERLDGSGFPAAVHGHEIHPLAPIIGAIREFQVLATRNDAPAPAAALAQLYRTRREAYGAGTIEHLIAALTIYPPGSFVALTDGRIARVARVSDHARLAPLVWIYDDSRAMAEAGIVDLSDPGQVGIERIIDPLTLPEAQRSWFGGEWIGLTFPAPAPPRIDEPPPPPTPRSSRLWS